MLRGPPAERGLLGLVTASLGGLTHADLESLTALPPHEVDDILTGVTERTISSRMADDLSGTGEHRVHFLAPHDTLQTEAERSLGTVLLVQYRQKLDEHAIRSLKGTLGLTAAKVRAPEQADRWVRLLMAAHAQLLLARPLAGDLRRPWEKQPDPARPLAPGQVRQGFRNIRRDLGNPPVSRNPPAPGPAGPKAAAKGQLPATFSLARPPCHARKTCSDQGKVKT